MKNKITAVIIALGSFVIACLPCEAQNFYTTLYDDSYAKCIELTNDSGYVTLGYKYNSSGSYGINYLLIKVDKYGDTVFCKTYSDNLSSFVGEQLMELPNRDLILLGRINGITLLIKVDSLGNMLWNKTYFDSTNAVVPAGICKNSDGGFTILSERFNPHRIILFRIDSIGNLIWSKATTSSLSYAEQIAPDGSGGYLVTGHLSSSSYIIKFDSTGIVLWSKEIADMEVGSGNSLLVNNDGSIVLTGSSEYSSGYYKAKLVKMDSLGTPIWGHAYHGLVNEMGNGVSTTHDNGYIICGSSFSSTTTLYPVEGCIIKTDSNGMLSWAKQFPLAFNDWGEAIKQTIDSGFVITGGKGQWGIWNDTEIFILKTDSAGITCITSNNITLTQNNGLPVILNITVNDTLIVLMTDTVVLQTTSSNLPNYHCPLSTEVKNFGNDENISIYPNPSYGKFFVSLSGSKKTKLELTDITEKKIAFVQRQVSGWMWEVDVTHYTKGVFVLRIIGEDGIHFEKVVMN